MREIRLIGFHYWVKTWKWFGPFASKQDAERFDEITNQSGRYS